MWQTGVVVELLQAVRSAVEVDHVDAIHSLEPLPCHGVVQHARVAYAMMDVIISSNIYCNNHFEYVSEL